MQYLHIAYTMHVCKDINLPVSLISLFRPLGYFFSLTAQPITFFQVSQYFFFSGICFVLLCYWSIIIKPFVGSPLLYIFLCILYRVTVMKLVCNCLVATRLEAHIQKLATGFSSAVAHIFLSSFFRIRISDPDSMTGLSVVET